MCSTKQITRCLILFLVFAAILTFRQVNSSQSQWLVLPLDDATINPITAEYISQGIDKASEADLAGVIVKLDTPGGLLSSTRTICKKILSSPVPVIVYIAPSGSRAGSAGVFITYASHIAAMAPSSNIGAAHPVEMGGGNGRRSSDRGLEEVRDSLQKLLKQRTANDADKDPVTNSENNAISEDDQIVKKEKVDSSDENNVTSEAKDPLADKILNDTVAFIKSMAQMRQRNEAWAIQSVTESDSITETEALEKKVVEIIARDENDLLKQLNGRVITVQDKEVTLVTDDATWVQYPMSFRQDFFNVLANPNIAYILMILGFYGLLFEITHPGSGVPGVLGAIFMILAFFSFQALPTNYAALALVLMGLVLMIVEAKAPGVGLWAVSGVACLLLGSFLLFDSHLPMFQVSIGIILGFSVSTLVIVFVLVQAVIRASQNKVQVGKEGMIGEQGFALSDLVPGQEGKVFVHGTIWNGISDEPISKDGKLQVLKTEGMLLKVKKI